MSCLRLQYRSEQKNVFALHVVYNKYRENHSIQKEETGHKVTESVCSKISINTVGSLVEQRQFGAWGTVDYFSKGLQASEFTHANTLLPRGYTGHEHFFSVALIHMNGRMYDQNLGRFLSPDVHIQEPFNTQSYNRYGYVVNNPLMYVDENGEFRTKWGRFWSWVGSGFKGSFVNRPDAKDPWNRYGISTTFDPGDGGVGVNFNFGINKRLQSQAEAYVARDRLAWSLGFTNYTGEWRNSAGEVADPFQEYDNAFHALGSQLSFATPTASLSGASSIIRGSKFLRVGKTFSKFKVARGAGRAFFSGAGTEARAIKEGFTTLSQTRAGQNLMKMTKGMPYHPGSKAYNWWGRLSSTYAKGIPKGSNVNVFLNNPSRTGIWNTIEKPILQQKGINIIYK